MTSMIGKSRDIANKNKAFRVLKALAKDEVPFYARRR